MQGKTDRVWKIINLDGDEFEQALDARVDEVVDQARAESRAAVAKMSPEEAFDARAVQRVRKRILRQAYAEYRKQMKPLVRYLRRAVGPSIPPRRLSPRVRPRHFRPRRRPANKSPGRRSDDGPLPPLASNPRGSLRAFSHALVRRGGLVEHLNIVGMGGCRGLDLPRSSSTAAAYANTRKDDRGQ
jgi:hypothetical protein